MYLQENPFCDDEAEVDEEDDDEMELRLHLSSDEDEDKDDNEKDDNDGDDEDDDAEGIYVNRCRRYVVLSKRGSTRYFYLFKMVFGTS